MSEAPKPAAPAAPSGLHVTHNDEADITTLEDYRKRRSQETGIKLTPLAFLVKAAVAALKAYTPYDRIAWRYELLSLRHSR